MRRGWVSALAVVGIVLWVGGRPAAAQSGGAGGLTALDTRHFALLKGDRIVIYEVDPSHGYALHVVNTALLDGEGRVMGQFRPEKPAVATPAPAPGKGGPPRMSPSPASEPDGPAPLSARRAPVPTRGKSFGRQARSPLAARPVQPIMQLAAGPAALRGSKLCDNQALRTGYLDVTTAQGAVPGP
jgi:hypothetical protein